VGEERKGENVRVGDVPGNIILVGVKAFPTETLPHPKKTRWEGKNSEWKISPCFSFK